MFLDWSVIFWNCVCFLLNFEKIEEGLECRFTGWCLWSPKGIIFLYGGLGAPLSFLTKSLLCSLVCQVKFKSSCTCLALVATYFFCSFLLYGLLLTDGMIGTCLISPQFETTSCDARCSVLCIGEYCSEGTCFYFFRNGEEPAPSYLKGIVKVFLVYILTYIATYLSL